MRPFEMWEPSEVAQAVALLDSAHLAPGSRAPRLLAGGQDLLGELKDDLARPAALINLKGIAGLDEIEEVASGGQSPHALRIGSLVTLARIADNATLQERYPLLCAAAVSVGSPQIRSQATLGGNLCQRPRCIYYRNAAALCLKKGGRECFAEGGVNRHNAILGGGPSWIVHPSDLAPALVALDASVELTSPTGTRELSLADFFTLPADGDVLRENRLGPPEMLTPLTGPAGGGRPGAMTEKATGGRSGDVRQVYMKFRERESFDFALVSVSMRVRVVDDRIRAARLVLGGVAPIPWRCLGAERLLADKPLEPQSFAAAAQVALAAAEPLEQNAYKVPLATTLIMRAGAALTAETR
ncbi:MAG: FAD binding domain-containing protein [Planctomycetota bacterium]|nr:FAD binding domain-containing protein [Planctomycetota bacterium]